MFSNPAHTSKIARLERLKERGLEQGPYQAILDFMDTSPGASFSMEELAKAAGLSKVAVRRYLNEMLEMRDIFSSVEMNTGSRPVMRYCRMEVESV